MDLILLVLVLCVIGAVVILIIRAAESVGLPAQWSKVLQLLALACLVLYVLTRFIDLPNVLPR